jgi:hypothetical protein
MEDWEKKLSDEKQAGTPARKVVRPIPEENAATNNNPATKVDEQTKVENKGSIENADANEDKATTRLLKIEQLPEKKTSLDQRRHLYPIMKLCMICLILAIKKKTNKIANTVSGLIVIAQESFA